MHKFRMDTAGVPMPLRIRVICQAYPGTLPMTGNTMPVI